MPPWSLRTPSRPHLRAFTLVELLVTLLLAALVMGATLSLLAVYVRHFQRVDALASAQMRGEMVAAILRNPIQHAGLGLSDDVPSQVFPGLGEVQTWGRTLEATSNDTVLRAVYGVPSGLVLVASDSVTLRASGSSGDTVALTLSAPVPADMAEVDGTRTQGWVFFAASEKPLRVQALAGATLTLRNPQSTDVTLAPYDELLWVRALRATRQGDTLYTEDVTLSPPAPRLEEGSLSDLRFQVQGGTCTVHVLACGQGGEGTPGIPPGWPASFGTLLPAAKAQAPHAYVRAAWRVRN